MTRWLLWGLVLLLLAAGAAWLVQNGEWVDVEVAVPARGEATADRLYPTQKLLRALGATVRRPGDVETLPPEHGTLVLAGRTWNGVVDRREAVRQWVERGGHLVIAEYAIDWEEPWTWLPVRSLDIKTVRRQPDRDCHARAIEGSDTGTALPAGSQARLCNKHRFETWRFASAAGGPPLLWSLVDAQGALVAQAAYGRGRVTAIGEWLALFNDSLLEGDHALLLAHALRVAPGSEIWIVEEASREPLLAWIWQQAWIAVLMAAAALAAAVWRTLPRFGPPQAPTPAHRRSMAEQIRGTAHFLHRHGRAALLQAQRRALDETAATHLRHYARLGPAERAGAIAQATGLPAGALQQGMQGEGAGTAAQLQLLETARRRLRQPDHPSDPPV